MLQLQISCFEKYFNKFSEVKDIPNLVKSYLQGKEEVKKDITRVIYLQEMTKFKEKQTKQTQIMDKIKQACYESIDWKDKRFKAFTKMDSRQKVRSVKPQDATRLKQTINLQEKHNEVTSQRDIPQEYKTSVRSITSRKNAIDETSQSQRTSGPQELQLTSSKNQLSISKPHYKISRGGSMASLKKL